MKPRFALNLSHDGIGLLHRAKRGWNLVGEARLDDPDLTKTLHMLRETASALENGGVRSKLVIPDSQILYTSIPAQEDGATKTEAQIRAGLEGLTPYDVDDLAFDWVIEGNEIRLAVVTHETLDEAEAFASEHRFNPVSFVAQPENGQFPGEPFFGPTGEASNLLGEDETLERDTEAIVVHGRTSLPQNVAAAAPAIAKAAPEESAVAVEDPAPAKDTESEDAPDVEKDATPVEAPESAEAAEPVEDPAPAKSAEPSEEPAPVESAETKEEPASDTPEDTVEDDAAETESAVQALADDATDTADVPEELADLPLPTEPPQAPSPPGMLDALASQSPRLQAFEAGQEFVPEGPEADTDTDTPLPPALSARMATAGHIPPAPTPDPGSAVFGGPAGNATATRKPGLLIFALAMLLMLGAAAALWAMLGMGTDQAELPEDITEIQTTALSPEPLETPLLPGDPSKSSPIVLQAAPSDTPAEPLMAALPGENALPTRIDVPTAAVPALNNAIEPTEDTADTPVQEASIAPQQAPVEDAVPAVETATRLDSTGPLDGTGPELAALDLGQITSDLAEPPALPESERSFEPSLPVPVEPTAEGALSYRGVLVFAGRPPVEVAARPDRSPAAPSTEADEATSEAPATETVPDQPNPQLAQYRPSARPRTAEPAVAEAEVEPATEPATETASDPEATPDETQNQNLGGINWAALRQYRPQSRPGSAVPAEPETSETAEAPVEEIAGPVSSLAVARSFTPVARPKNFSQSVQRALRQVQPEAPAAPPVPTAAAMTPRNPTVSSVARQATETNAIRLNRLNLIGVYGSNSDRRALVRLPSGRYVKLQIGDRLDGGKVAAINERELRYVKGGRSIVLSMPQG